MRVFESAYHLVLTSLLVNPDYVCIGKCRHILWRHSFPFPHVVATLKCDCCGGSLAMATKGVDYTEGMPERFAAILQSDLQYYTAREQQNGWFLFSLHRVKPEFEELAKREWCAQSVV